MKQYDVEKFQRLRHRRDMLFNERSLLANDLREHRTILESRRKRYGELEKLPEPPIFVDVDGAESQPGAATLGIANKELEKAEELFALAERRHQEIELEAASMGGLVARLEETITQEWRLKLPVDSRLNSPGAKRVGPEFQGEVR